MKRVGELIVLLLPFLSSAAWAQFKFHQEPDPSLYVESVGALPACDLVIDTPAKWSEINSPSHRVFCVAPGDYRSAGTVRLTADGTAEARRWIRLFEPGLSDDAHVYSLPEPDKAITRDIDFNDASYWVIDRITLDGTGEASTAGSFLTGGSSHNVFNRVEVREWGYGLILRDECAHNVIQRSVFHDQKAVDLAYIGLSAAGNGTAKFTRIVHNECWNANDCIQLIKSQPEDVVSYDGTVIYNNDLYQTDAKYTDCSGNYTTTGPCAASENAIDLKAASGNAEAPVIVAHNRMWGFRRSDQSSVFGPFRDAGNAIVDHFGIYNLRVEGNIFFDNTRHYLQGTSAIRKVNLSDNLFHTPYDQRPLENGSDGLALTGTPVEELTITGNVFSTALVGYRLLQVNSTVAGSATFAMTNNIFIDIDAVFAPGTLAGTASGNGYFNAAIPPWDGAPARNESAVVGSQYDNEFCTIIKRITNPTKKCFANAAHEAWQPTTSLRAPARLRVVD